jgi:hypothetical protein
MLNRLKPNATTREPGKQTDSVLFCEIKRLYVVWLDKIIYFGGLGMCVDLQNGYALFYALFLKKRKTRIAAGR